MAKKGKELTLEEKLEQALVPAEEQPYEVPENWCWTYLGQVADWGSGGTPSRKHPEYYDGFIPWIKTGELNDGYIYDSEEKITEEAVQNSSAKIFPKDTVVIAMYGATIGKVGILGIDATTNQACACAKCRLLIDTKFLFYYAISQKDAFIEKGKGGAQPNISQDIIKKHAIPLPPLAEQQRIVDRIESLFAKLDEAKEKIQNVLDESENRKNAILHKAFMGELTEEWRKEHSISKNTWKEKKFQEVGKLERGRSKHRPRNDAVLFGGKYPFIQTGDIASADMYVTSHKQTLSEIGYEQSRLFPKGTVCITIAANIGDTAILSYDCCFPDSVVGFTPNSDCDAKYIYFYLNEIKRELERIAPATAQKNLNLQLLGNIDVNLPTMDEQNVIVEILEKQLQRESRIHVYVDSTLETIELVKKSILAKAFRGELGTNDSSDEDAIELLKSVLEA